MYKKFQRVVRVCVFSETFHIKIEKSVKNTPLHFDSDWQNDSIQTHKLLLNLPRLQVVDQSFT